MHRLHLAPSRKVGRSSTMVVGSEFLNKQSHAPHNPPMRQVAMRVTSTYME